MLGNGIAPRYSELVNPAVRLTFGANYLVKLAGIEIDGRRGGSGGRSFERRLARRQRRMDRAGNFHRIAVPAHVHVEGCRACAQKMIVDCCDVEIGRASCREMWLR